MNHESMFECDLSSIGIACSQATINHYLNPSTMTYRNLLCALLASASIAWTAQAAENEAETTCSLPATTITAERIALPIDEVSSSLTIIDATQLEQTRDVFVVDALRRVPGVQVRRNGGAGAAASVSLRGTDARQTLVLINGVEVGDSLSIGSPYDFSLMPVANIERIEVLRGAHSPLYGSDAIGGVINIITKQGTSPTPTLVTDFAAGTYGTRQASATFSGAAKGWDYNAFASSYETEGFSHLAPRDAEADDFENHTFQGQLGYTFSERLVLRAFGQYVESQTDFDDYFTPDPNQVLNATDNRQSVLKLNADLEVIEGLWTTLPTLRFARNERDSRGPFPSDFESRTWGFDWQHNLTFNDYFSLVTGLEYEEDDGESVSSGINDGLNTKAAYARLRLTWEDRLFLSAGGRFDDHSLSGTEETWQLSGTYHHLETNTRLKANYGTAFNAPNSYQLFAPDVFGFSVGNPNLRPEKANSFDVGIEQDLCEKRLTTGLTYFYNDIDEQIDYDFTLGYVNLDSVRTQGYEGFLSADLTDKLTLNVNYTWQDTLDRTNGTDIARQPHQTYSANLNWLTAADHLNLNIGVLHVGQRFDKPVEVDPMVAYTVWNTAASWTINELATVYMRVDNLFDKNYQEVKEYATAGRSVLFGVRYTFE